MAWLLQRGSGPRNMHTISFYCIRDNCCVCVVFQSEEWDNRLIATDRRLKFWRFDDDAQMYVCMLYMDFIKNFNHLIK